MRCLGLCWCGPPIVKRGTERIDRAFFRSAYDARVILQDVAEKARAVTERHELASLLELEIGGALHPKSLACYLEAGDGNFVAEHGTTHRDSGIVSWGINPRTFTGRYESQLSSHGITPEDWSAILGAQSGFYGSFTSAVDFFISQAIEAVLSANSGASSTDRDATDKSAVASLRKLDGSFDVSTLMQVLMYAVQNYPATDWGYWAAGDGRDEAVRLGYLAQQ